MNSFIKNDSGTNGFNLEAIQSRQLDAPKASGSKKGATHVTTLQGKIQGHTVEIRIFSQGEMKNPAALLDQKIKDSAIPKLLKDTKLLKGKHSSNRFDKIYVDFWSTGELRNIKVRDRKLAADQSDKKNDHFPLAEYNKLTKAKISARRLEKLIDSYNQNLPFVKSDLAQRKRLLLRQQLNQQLSTSPGLEQPPKNTSKEKNSLLLSKREADEDDPLPEIPKQQTPPPTPFDKKASSNLFDKLDIEPIEPFAANKGTRSEKQVRFKLENSASFESSTKPQPKQDAGNLSEIQKIILEIPCDHQKVRLDSDFIRNLATDNKPFTKSELAVFERFSRLAKAIENQEPFEPLSKESKKEFVQILRKAIGNKEVYKQIREKYSHASESSPEIIKYFALATYNLQDKLNAASLGFALLEKLDNKQQINPHEKITLEQLGHIELIGHSRIVDLFDFLRLHDEDKDLAAVVDLIRPCVDVAERIKKKEEDFSNYKSGDLAFTDLGKHFRYIGRKPGFADKIQEFLLDSPLLHVGMIVKDNEEDMLSEISAKHALNSFGLKRKATSNVYRIDPSRLLGEASRSLLNEAFGEDEAASRFVELHQELQAAMHETPEKFASIENTSSRRIKSRLADLCSELHTTDKNRDYFKKLHKKFTEDGGLENKNMICSEFAAKSIVAGLYGLEQRLWEDMANALAEKKSISPEEAKKQMEIKLGGVDLLQIPIDPTEKLSRITPPRLLNLLAAKGCLQRVPPTPVLRAIVQPEDLAPTNGESIVQKEISLTTQEERDKDQMILNIHSGENSNPNQVFKLPENPSIIDKFFMSSLGVHKERDELTPQDKKQLATARNTITQIKKAQDYFNKQKGIWKNRLSDEDIVQQQKVQKILDSGGQLEPSKNGQGGAYFLKDSNGKAVGLLKPNDEGILALNNHKGFATYFIPDTAHGEGRLRRTVPVHNDIETEALSYKASESFGMRGITPKVSIGIVTSDQFHHLMDGTVENNDPDFQTVKQELNTAETKKKLCSVQEFIERSVEWKQFKETLAEKQNKVGLVEREAAKIEKNLVDPESYEDCLLYTILIGDTDGNAGNYRVVDQGEAQKPRFRMMKVDNALAFPENNSEFYTCLDESAHLLNPLSDKARKTIENVNPEEIEQLIRLFRQDAPPKSAEASISAFKKRLDLLQNAAKSESITLFEIYTNMTTLAKEDRSLPVLSKAADKQPDQKTDGNRQESVIRQERDSSVVYQNRDSSVIYRNDE